MSYVVKNLSTFSIGTVTFEVSLAKGKWQALHDLNVEIVARCVAELRQERSLRLQYKDHFAGDTLMVAYKAFALPIDPNLEDYSYDLR